MAPPPEVSEAWKEKIRALDRQDLLPEEDRADAEALGILQPRSTTPQPRISPFAAPDPRASSPWYQDAWKMLTGQKSLLKEGQSDWETLKQWGGELIRGAGPPSPTEPGSMVAPEQLPPRFQAPPLQPGEITDQRRRAEQLARRAGREIVEQLPTVATLLTPFGMASRGLTGLAWIANEIGVPAARGALTFVGQDFANRAANWLDPANAREPTGPAAVTGALETFGELGGRRLAGPVKRLQEAWQETPMGSVHREVIENLGEDTTLGIGSERFWPKTVDYALQHTPLGGRVRGVYERATARVDDALKTMESQYPAGQLDAARQALGARVERRSTPGMLRTQPEILRTTLSRSLEDRKAALKAEYAALDQNYLQRPIPWHFGKQRLPYVTSLEDLMLDPRQAQQYGVTPESIFGRATVLIKSLEAQPDHIPLQQALQNERALNALITEAEEHLGLLQRQATGPAQPNPLTDSIRYQLLPDLATAQQQVTEQIMPYTVDLGPAQAKARAYLGQWETMSLQTPEAALQGGQAGRMGATEDPHIMAARGLDRLPRFVLFQDAQQFRSQFLEISRLPGPNIGNTVAAQGKEIGDLIDTAMTKTATGLTPDLEPMWRHANAAYAQAANTWNSPYVMNLTQQNLDDWLTNSVQRERPNDLKTLREVLGPSEFSNVGQMWLTRQIEAARDPATGLVKHEDLLQRLNSLTDVAEEQLFPRGVRGTGGLTRIRNELRNSVNMQQAADEALKGEAASPVLLQTHKSALTDPTLWNDVQSDVIGRMFRSGNDPVSGEKLMNGLNKLAHVKHVLFTPGHYDELLRFAHTARALEQTASMGKLWWTPAVQMVEHGMILHFGLDAFHHPERIPLYLLGTAGLSYLMTDPKTVARLRTLMTTPHNTAKAGAVSGMLLGQLAQQVLAGQVIDLNPPARRVEDWQPEGDYR